jgi:hypothetical protein
MKRKNRNIVSDLKRRLSAPGWNLFFREYGQRLIGIYAGCGRKATWIPPPFLIYAGAGEHSPALVLFHAERQLLYLILSDPGHSTNPPPRRIEKKRDRYIGNPKVKV